MMNLIEEATWRTVPLQEQRDSGGSKAQTCPHCFNQLKPVAVTFKGRNYTKIVSTFPDLHFF